jgi:hypothetical protein
MKVEIIPAEPSHLVGLLGRTQFANVHGAEESLKHHMLLSESAWIAKVDGEVMVAWGVIPPCMLSSSAYVWVVVADAIKDDSKYKFLFIRYSQRILEVMLQKYESLYGFCYPYQVDSIKWIKFLGGEFRGTDDQNRIPFQLRRK